MNSDADIDVVAIGNALVDVLATEDEDFVREHGLERGAAVMVAAHDVERVHAAMGETAAVSGGSAANTVAGIAALGGTSAFVGKVRDDDLGRLFRADLESLGVRFDTPPATDGPPTGRCLVIVTPDHERTMCTYLGIAERLGPADVPAEVIEHSKVTYVEGYLWDQPPAKDAIRSAFRIASAAGSLVAFTLSDPFCVDRHRAEFLALLEESVDILFANHVEICALLGVDDFEEAVDSVADRCRLAALTRSEEGSVVVADGQVHAVPAEPTEVVDVTGAGDLYAAGFLFGLTRGLPPDACGRLGSLAASEVVSHLGARPEADLGELAAGVLPEAR